MPKILSRTSVQDRRVARNRISTTSSEASGGVWMTPVVFDGFNAINHSADVSLGGSMERLSIASGTSTPSIQKEQSASSSIRRNCSMTFSDYQSVESKARTRHDRPTLCPTHSSGQVDDGGTWGMDDGDTWGHFVDVAAADEEVSRYSRLLSSRPFTNSM